MLRCKRIKNNFVTKKFVRVRIQGGKRSNMNLPVRDTAALVSSGSKFYRKIMDGKRPMLEEVHLSVAVWRCTGINV
jgi:hypothetical protein